MPYLALINCSRTRRTISSFLKNTKNKFFFYSRTQDQVVLSLRRKNSSFLQEDKEDKEVGVIEMWYFCDKKYQLYK